MSIELKPLAWAYAEERFGRHVMRLSIDKTEPGEPLVLLKDAQAAIASAIAEEREACAKACEALRCEGYGNFDAPTRGDCIKAIRARGAK